jgi:uncharacterized membrane protein YdcZ (DUF606 family)
VQAGSFEIIEAGEGIRTLDPNLGKIRFDVILPLHQIVIWPLRNPNIFSGIFSESFVFCAVAEAATLNNPATHHVCVLISRQMRSGCICDQFRSF